MKSNEENDFTIKIEVRTVEISPMSGSQYTYSKLFDDLKKASVYYDMKRCCNHGNPYVDYSIHIIHSIN